jgi:hypothetical protein
MKELLLVVRATMRTKIVLVILLSTGLFSLTASADMQGSDPSASVTDKGKKKSDSTKPPSEQEIANAKSQGLVWVNLSTRVYHKNGDFYGKTKRGKFETEEDAKKEGFHEAQPSATTKKTTPKQGDQSGLDSTKDTHSSVAPKP